MGQAAPVIVNSRAEPILTLVSYVSSHKWKPAKHWPLHFKADLLTHATNLLLTKQHKPL